MYQGAYTSGSWATQVATQPNPEERIRPLVEACGGRLESIYYSLGEYDVVLIMDMPDDEAAAALSLAANAGGSLGGGLTTKAVTGDQGLSAMLKTNAASCGDTHTICPDAITEGCLP